MIPVGEERLFRFFERTRSVTADGVGGPARFYTLEIGSTS